MAAIEQQFTRLDSGVAALQRARIRLKRYRAAVLKAAVEGKLTETWRAEHPNTEPASLLLGRILDERRAKWEADLRAKGKDPAEVKYVEPVTPDVESLPNLSERWCWATMEQIAAAEPNAITDGPFGSNLKTEHYTSEGARIIRLQNVGDGEFRDEKAFVTLEHFEKLRKHRAFAGKLVPQDPSDEPASELLERIRSEQSIEQKNGTGTNKSNEVRPVKVPEPGMLDVMATKQVELWENVENEGKDREGALLR